MSLERADLSDGGGVGGCSPRVLWLHLCDTQLLCLLTHSPCDFCTSHFREVPWGATAESVTAPFSSWLQSPLGSVALRLHCEITAAIHQVCGGAVLKHSLVTHPSSCAYLFIWHSTDKPWKENHWHFSSYHCCCNWYWKRKQFHLAENSLAPDLLGCLEPLSCYILIVGSPLKVPLHFWVIYKHCGLVAQREKCQMWAMWGVFFFFQVLIVSRLCFLSLRQQQQLSERSFSQSSVHSCWVFVAGTQISRNTCFVSLYLIRRFKERNNSWLRAKWDKAGDNTLHVYTLICFCLKYYCHLVLIFWPPKHTACVSAENIYFMCLYINGVPVSVPSASSDKFICGSRVPLQTTSAI